ncbi:hypothetical protein [Sandaracinus amylolyticus]|uniref:Recombination-associated protein RdgC n=1 Tax=Sandaracinus amylolyticus TaxID=927083 RepID=A0A0F6YF16_9BACT|nr:hypothetical protein [Sandaracinus amylolyticus]AKF03116.1 hypothetical protein DB32_000265 [Sandaracinus amylolyticus]
MDYVDRIERARFLGREFLVWLWHESEAKEGVLTLSNGEACEVWLEAQLTLVGAEDEKSESKLKSAMPSASPEAKEALRQGKLPIKAKLRIARGTQTWGFLLNADTLSIASVQIPALLREENDEKFYERMELVETLETILDDLLGQFLELRTSETWDGRVMPQLRDWVRAA